MDNLFESVIKVKIPAVYTIEELIEFHEALIAESGIENGEIYTQITRGTADYGLAFPEMSVPQLTMTIVKLIGKYWWQNVRAASILLRLRIIAGSYVTLIP